MSNRSGGGGDYVVIEAGEIEQLHAAFVPVDEAEAGGTIEE
ncbi:hypothetical protein NY542_04295 [Curtobacterium flaccumfaciens pv. betae]|nr:hypothetical protein [Curtobacterium flaccumfaciens]MCS5466420.1 hypothetical protein [Curtobacterium flaccumfaciens pv. betae]